MIQLKQPMIWLRGNVLAMRQSTIRLRQPMILQMRQPVIQKY
jgi:hypothetical protein